MRRTLNSVLPVAVAAVAAALTAGSTVAAQLAMTETNPSAGAQHTPGDFSASDKHPCPVC